MKVVLIYFDITPGKQAEFEAATSFHLNNSRTRDPSYSLYISLGTATPIRVTC